MATDPELRAHQEWLGYLQPVGLVVSPPALLQAQAHVNANVAAEHQRFIEHVADVLMTDDRHWQATPHARFERLLRETHVPIGLLSNATHLRLVYAPRGETTGYLTFPTQAMTEVAGRPIFSALLMLLSAERL